MRKRVFLAAVMIMISSLLYISTYAKSNIQLDGSKLREEIENLINEERRKYCMCL